MDVGMLQVANTPVHHLEAMRGGAGGEIFPLDESGTEPAERSFTCGGGSSGTAANDQHVERFCTQSAKVAGVSGPVLHAVIIANPPQFRPIPRALPSARCAASELPPAGMFSFLGRAPPGVEVPAQPLYGEGLSATNNSPLHKRAVL